MSNYFDALLAKRQLPFNIVPPRGDAPNLGASPIAAWVAPDAPVSLPTDASTLTSPADYQPVGMGIPVEQSTPQTMAPSAPVPVDAPQAPAQPVPQFAAPAQAPVAPAPVAASQPVHQPVVAQFQAPYAPTNNEAALSPEAIKRTEALHGDITALINSNLTNDQVRQALTTRLAQDGQHLDSLTGLGEALDWRAKHHGDKAGGVGIGVRVATPQAILDGQAAAKLTAEQEAVRRDGHDTGFGDALASHIGNGLLFGGAAKLGAGVNAGVNSIGNLLGIGNGKSFGDQYEAEKALNNQNLDDASFHHPVASGLGEGAGMIASGVATGGLGGEAALAAGGSRALGRLAAEGATSGLISGAAGSRSDTWGGVAADAATSALAGGVLGPALGGPLNAVARRIEGNIAAGGNLGSRTIGAADRLNQSLGLSGEDAVRPMLGQTSHGHLGSVVSGVTEGSVTGGQIGGLARAQQGFEATTGRALGAIANREVGGVADNLDTAAQRAADPNRAGSIGAYVDDNAARVGDQYTRAEAMLPTGRNNAMQTPAGEVHINTPQAVQRLDEVIADASAHPGLVGNGKLEGALNAMRSLRANLTRGQDAGATSAGWTVSGLRKLRTDFGDNFDVGDRYARSLAKRIWEPLTTDIYKGLRLRGYQDAATAFRSADREWDDHLDTTSIIKKITGKDNDLSPDAVADNLSRMSANDYANLSHVLDRVHPQIAADIRGGIISKLGAKTASRTEGAHDAFSLESFATNWHNSHLSDQAKAALFRNSPQTVRDLNDLANIAGSNRAYRASSGNPSKSGIYGVRSVELGSAGIAVGAAIANPLALLAPALTLVGGFSAGKILASPGVARMMVRAANSGNVAGLTRALSRTATRNSALAPAIGSVLRGLNQSAPAVRTREANPFDKFDSDTGPSLSFGGHSDPVVDAAPEAPVVANPEANPFDQFDDHAE